ncbi:hypothetical protein JAAARDRAFT_30897 [Jaapia argillacea MUCL 33604]|uniref:Uncharacterized protein n=1 Tax=Jaapia argillacea MUCL 33604 TaxID=933084 RepID=A0A067Q341_9AGAM|nr:hypothetical protein JAAARDRAFT_30897 [Jaapia argillacea MUCL 33604]
MWSLMRVKSCHEHTFRGSPDNNPQSRPSLSTSCGEIIPQGALLSWLSFYPFRTPRTSIKTTDLRTMIPPTTCTVLLLSVHLASTATCREFTGFNAFSTPS